jgi:hypothetical protein
MVGFVPKKLVDSKIARAHIGLTPNYMGLGLMPLSLLTPAGRFDRSAIMHQAWATARAALVPPRPIRGFTPAPRPTLREAFKEALRRAWDLARGQRACHQHRAATMSETVRRSALPAIEREVLALRDARAIAPMTDSTRAMVADLVAIDARALALGVRL